MPNAAVRNGLMAGSFFFAGGTGTERTSPLTLGETLLASRSSIPGFIDARVFSAGLRSASCAIGAGRAESAGSCSWAAPMKQKDVGSIINRAASFIRLMVSLSARDALEMVQLKKAAWF